MRLSYFHGFRRRWLCSRCETRQTCKSHLVLRAVSPPWHVLVWILPLNYEVSSIILVFTLMLMFMYRVYQKKWLPSRQTRSPIEIAESFPCQRHSEKYVGPCLFGFSLVLFLEGLSEFWFLYRTTCNLGRQTCKSAKISTRRFHKNQIWEIHIAQSGLLVLGPVETNVRKCIFPEYVPFP